MLIFYVLIKTKLKYEPDLGTYFISFLDFSNVWLISCIILMFWHKGWRKPLTLSSASQYQNSDELSQNKTRHHALPRLFFFFAVFFFYEDHLHNRLFPSQNSRMNWEPDSSNFESSYVDTHCLVFSETFQALVEMGGVCSSLAHNQVSILLIHAKKNLQCLGFIEIIFVGFSIFIKGTSLIK